MTALHPHLFQQSIVDESEIHQLVTNYFLSDHVVLQWHPAAEEDIPTPKTKEIVVFSSFFQRGFCLSACDFPIPTIPVSTQSPSSESASDPSAGASAGSSKTQTDK
jgi:hypothetical protein